MHFLHDWMHDSCTMMHDVLHDIMHFCAVSLHDLLHDVKHDCQESSIFVKLRKGMKGKLLLSTKEVKYFD